MPRQRSANRDEAQKIYIKKRGKIQIKEIADMLGETPGTVRGWKAKDKWDDILNGTLQTKGSERSEKNTSNNAVKNKKGKTLKTAPDPKNSETNSDAYPSSKSKDLRPGTGRKYGTLLGNKNAAGNGGGNGGPPGNKYALKHGAYERIVASDLTDEQWAAIDEIITEDITAQNALLREAFARNIKMAGRIKKAEEQALNLKSAPSPMFIGKVTQDKGKTTTKFKGKAGNRTIEEDRDNNITEIQPIVEIIDMIERGQSVNMRIIQGAINHRHKMRMDKEYLDIDKEKLGLAKEKAGAAEVMPPVFISGEDDLID